VLGDTRPDAVQGAQWEKQIFLLERWIEREGRMAVDRVGGSPGVPQFPESTTSSETRGAANAGDADKFQGLLRPGAEGANAGKPSEKEIAHYNHLQTMAKTIIQKGNLTAEDRQNLENIGGQLKELASRYPPTREDQRRLNDLESQAKFIETRKPMTPADHQQFNALIREMSSIRYKAFD
jgi:polyhydroxyalkanoate synthesis regulator phasin